MACWIKTLHNSWSRHNPALAPDVLVTRPVSSQLPATLAPDVTPRDLSARTSHLRSLATVSGCRVTACTSAPSQERRAHTRVVCRQYQIQRRTRRAGPSLRPLASAAPPVTCSVPARPCLSTRCVNRFVSPISLLVNLANTATVTKLSAVRPRSDFAPKPQPVATAPARKRATITFPHVAWLTLVADRIQRKEVGVVVVGREGERHRQSTSKSGLLLRKKKAVAGGRGGIFFGRERRRRPMGWSHMPPLACYPSSRILPRRTPIHYLANLQA